MSRAASSPTSSPPPPAEPSIERPLPPDVVKVRTAIDLQLAVISGIRDIEVVEHLDMRELQLLQTPGNQPDSNTTSGFMLYSGTNTRSIRV
jgi:hypothetical protein